MQRVYFGPLVPAASGLSVMGLALLACPIPALAQSATTNLTQVSVNVAPISITGERLGGSVNASGNGLTGGAPPTVAADGSLNSGTTMQAAVGTTFNFNVTARSGDQVAAAGALGTALVPTSQFGSQTGRYSGSGTGAALAITGANAATVAAGTTQGVTATAIISTSMQTGANTAEVRRVGTSANQQATFTAERQGAQFQFGGSGLTAVSAGGLSTGGVTALGADPSITAAGGGTTQTNVAFTLTQQARTGQAAAAVTATVSDVTQPGYGTFTNTLGGTAAGAITPTNVNTMIVAPGGQGTTSTLSVVQSLTAF